MALRDRPYPSFTRRLITLGATFGWIFLFTPTAAANPPLNNLKDPRYWSNLCALLSTTKNTPEAITTCAKAIEQQPRNPELWSRLSDLHLRQQEYPEAFAAASQALLQRRANSQALTQQCIAQARLGQADALKLNTNWGTYQPIQAQRYRGIAFDQATLHQEALALYNQTLNQNPTDSLTLTYRCETLLKLQRPQEAQADCQAALAGNQQWGTESPVLALQNLGIAYNQQAQYATAIATFDQAIAQNDKAAAAWTQQAWAMTQLKQYHNALASYNRAVALQPTSSRALVGQCQVLNQLKQHEPALASCQKAIEGDGQWWPEGLAQAFNQQSHALAGLKRYDEALAIANRTIGISPNYAKAWNDRSVVYWLLAKYPEALTDTEKASQLNPQDARPWANRGRIFSSMENWQAAITAYDQALVLDPNDAETWANRSATLWTLGQVNESLVAADQAIQQDAQSVSGWYNRAIALTTLQRFPEARATYTKALELAQTNPTIWANFGVLLIQLRDYEPAQQALQTALKLDPEQPIAQQAMLILTEWQQAKSTP
jgi:tetratricopeptide (TPR) repeat protein